MYGTTKGSNYPYPTGPEEYLSLGSRSAASEEPSHPEPAVTGGIERSIERVQSVHSNPKQSPKLAVSNGVQSSTASASSINTAEPNEKSAGEPSLMLNISSVNGMMDGAQNPYEAEEMGVIATAKQYESMTHAGHVHKVLGR